MHKIKVYTIGKIKETWLEEGLEEYSKRLKAVAAIEWILAKNTQQLEQIVKNESYLIGLDPQGKQFTSEKFAAWLESSLIERGSRLSFLIGGAEGLSASLKHSCKHLFSLSELTFTHQMARLLLLEQIYRAFEILKGSAYHKQG